MFKGINEPLAPLHLGWDEDDSTVQTDVPISSEPDIKIVDLYFDAAPHGISARLFRRSDDTAYDIPPDYEFFAASLTVQPQLRGYYKSATDRSAFMIGLADPSEGRVQTWFTNPRLLTLADIRTKVIATRNRDPLPSDDHTELRVTTRYSFLSPAKFNGTTMKLFIRKKSLAVHPDVWRDPILA